MAEQASGAGPTLLAIRYTHADGEAPTLDLLDQKLLPHHFEYIPILTSADGWNAIRNMQVRGAPAIAITAALALAVEASSQKSELADDVQKARSWLESQLDYLQTSRPTAVNLFNDCKRLKHFIGAVEAQDGQELVEAYVAEAEKMLANDIADNESIGRHGAELILSQDGVSSKARVLTHCNTGSLATARFGTALGIIRALHQSDSLEHAYCTETRPYNQGSRLTAFELVFEGIPSTLICDSAAAAMMAVKGVDAIVVGADRVVANGDTANKIGTYSLAIVARHHGVKFYVAAPFTTLDVNMSSGDEITIEERKGEELACVNGDRIAAEGIGIWNPAFDVTPAHLIDGIVTEHGAILKEDGSDTFDVTKFVQMHSSLH